MLRFFVPAAMMLALGLTGCSDDKNCHDEPCAATPAGSTTPGPSLNDCTSYTAGTTIVWGFDAKPPSTCLLVKKGGSVTFNGPFTTHPLTTTPGGATPNPIQLTTTGDTKSFTFDAVGTYGFTCANHPTMKGAINVTE